VTSPLSVVNSIGDRMNFNFRLSTDDLKLEAYIIRDGVSIPYRVMNLIRETFIEAVEIRLKSDRPIGCLLSGGLDSSLVVSIASRYLKMRGRRLRTFSIGIPGSTDREYAEMVAKYCDTDHKHVEFSEADFLEAVPEVVRATETYDITTVRASVGQYLISKWIAANTDIRVLLIGDGSDELCTGYMYFHNAPGATESHQENARLIEHIQYYDALRADRCIAFNGIEARVPFLDHMFVDLYLSIPHEFRVPIREITSGRRIEKWLLRKSFDEIQYSAGGTNFKFLPDDVLWRKKEAFSDGVSSRKRSWYQIIQADLENKYSDEDFKHPDVHHHQSPFTKEALHYRKLFNEYFDPLAASVVPYYWMPKWSGDVRDPSARVLKVYDS
jgi:asparagine synthase (glutamine-hydrolysing)